MRNSHRRRPTRGAALLGGTATGTTAAAAAGSGAGPFAAHGG
ncbi:hypothetical protein ACFZAU_22825 [Streptomyces sp. NPDC008238]